MTRPYLTWVHSEHREQDWLDRWAEQPFTRDNAERHNALSPQDAAHAALHSYLRDKTVRHNQQLEVLVAMDEPHNFHDTGVPICLASFVFNLTTNNNTQERSFHMTIYIAVNTRNPDTVADYLGFGFEEIDRGRNRFGDHTLVLCGPKRHAEWQAARLCSGLHGACVTEDLDGWKAVWGYVSDNAAAAKRP